MSLDELRRRLSRFETSKGDQSPFDRLPVVRLITETRTDRDRQLAALEAAGRYRAGQFLIERRIVDPASNTAEMHS